MKKVIRYIVLLLAVVIYACGSSETPVVVARVDETPSDTSLEESSVAMLQGEIADTAIYRKRSQRLLAIPGSDTFIYLGVWVEMNGEYYKPGKTLNIYVGIKDLSGSGRTRIAADKLPKLLPRVVLAVGDLVSDTYVEFPTVVEFADNYGRSKSFGYTVVWPPTPSALSSNAPAGFAVADTVQKQKMMGSDWTLVGKFSIPYDEIETIEFGEPLFDVTNPPSLGELLSYSDLFVQIYFAGTDSNLLARDVRIRRKQIHL